LAEGLIRGHGRFKIRGQEANMPKKASFDADRPNESAPSAKETAGSRHPLIGWMKGTFTIAEGVDLTEPACPEWADLIDEKMPIQRAGKDTSS
jgi:hypothetical protein